MQERLLKIIETKGPKNATNELQIKTYNLLEQVLNYDNAKKLLDQRLPLLEKLKSKIKNSISEVYLIMEQLRIYYNISREEIKEIVSVDEANKIPELYMDLCRFNCAVIELEMAKTMYFKDSNIYKSYELVLKENMAELYLSLKNMMLIYEFSYCEIEKNVKSLLLREEMK